MSGTPHPAHGRPQRIVHEGRYAQLEPIGPAHAADLFAAASAPDAERRFAFLFEHPPADLAEMEARVTLDAAEDDPLTFAVVDKATGRAGGRQALMHIVPEHGVIEIGAICWGHEIARTRVTTEAFYLAARHVFEDLRYRRLEWKCNALNAPSRAAALRFGFVFEGAFRQHMIVKGENRDTAWFSMLDGEWPRLRPAYERWLEPDNFDAGGGQLTPLRFEQG